MIGHFLRSAWRTLRRNVFYSLVNIGCLAVGLAVAMTILLYVLHEHSYDRWQANADRTFSSWGTFHFGSSEYHSAALSFVTGPMLQKEDGNVESYVRTWQGYKAPLVQNAAKAAESVGENGPFLFADANFFRFFSFRLLRGSRDEVLRRPNTVVVTEKAAKKYFGNADPIGKVLLYDKDLRLEVTGVAADPPSNTGIEFDFVGTLAGSEAMPVLKQPLAEKRPGGGNFETWFRLKDASAAAKVAGTLTRITHNADPDGEKSSFELVPLARGHLFGTERGVGSYLEIFPYVAGLVLLLALINYMSLATARSAMRAREVGVRKVLGAGRGICCGAVLYRVGLICGVVVWFGFWTLFVGAPGFPEFVTVEDRPLVSLDASGGRMFCGAFVAGDRRKRQLSVAGVVGVQAGSRSVWQVQPDAERGAGAKGVYCFSVCDLDDPDPVQCDRRKGTIPDTTYGYRGGAREYCDGSIRNQPPAL